jgi:hypothetical protein
MKFYSFREKAAWLGTFPVSLASEAVNPRPLGEHAVGPQTRAN